MNTIKLLAKQTHDAYNWVFKLIDKIPYDRWDETPENLDTNVSWQIGHLIMSYYYNTAMSTIGHQKEVFAEIPLKEYSPIFSFSPAKDAIGKANPATLHKQLKFISERSIVWINKVQETDLDKPLEELKVPHPIAKTKYEVIDWNIKHTMWHCGQLSTLKRVLGDKMEFGK